LNAGDRLCLLRDAPVAEAGYRAVDGDLHYAFGARGVPLVCTRAVPGAAAGDDAPWRYIVETDVLPELEADFNAWYDTEHLAGLAAVPGVVRAARWLDAAGSPRYIACYDLARREAYNSPPWLAVRATAWSSRVRPTFRNTRRTMFERLPR
jgi:hypothetical protein